MIKIQNLSKKFKDLVVLKDISLEINKGEVVAIIGPSGSGKSTLLRCINLLEMPSGGQILINGQSILDKSMNVEKLRKNIGMVFQHFNLFPHMTVLRNMTYAPMVVRIPQQAVRRTEAEGGHCPGAGYGTGNTPV